MNRLIIMILLVFMIIGLILFSFLEKDEDIMSNSLLYGLNSEGDVVSRIDQIIIVSKDNDEISLSKRTHSLYIEKIISSLMDIELEVSSSINIDDDSLFIIHTSDSKDIRDNTHPLVTDRIVIMDKETILFSGLKPIAGIGEPKLYVNKVDASNNILNIIETIDEFKRLNNN